MRALLAKSLSGTLQLFEDESRLQPVESQVSHVLRYLCILKAYALAELTVDQWNIARFDIRGRLVAVKSAFSRRSDTTVPRKPMACSRVKSKVRVIIDCLFFVFCFELCEEFLAGENGCGRRNWLGSFTFIPSSCAEYYACWRKSTSSSESTGRRCVGGVQGKLRPVTCSCVVYKCVWFVCILLALL